MWGREEGSRILNTREENTCNIQLERHIKTEAKDDCLIYVKGGTQRQDGGQGEKEERKTIQVTFQGSREAHGALTLEGTIEYMWDPVDQYKLTEDKRQLGLIVYCGTSVVISRPQDDTEAIPNPFTQQQDT